MKKKNPHLANELKKAKDRIAYIEKQLNVKINLKEPPKTKRGIDNYIKNLKKISVKNYEGLFNNKVISSVDIPVVTKWGRTTTETTVRYLPKDKELKQIMHIWSTQGKKKIYGSKSWIKAWSDRFKTKKQYEKWKARQNSIVKDNLLNNIEIIIDRIQDADETTTSELYKIYDALEWLSASEFDKIATNKDFYKFQNVINLFDSKQGIELTKSADLLVKHLKKFISY